MEYLLTVEEIEKLYQKEKDLNEEASQIVLKVKEIVKNDYDFLNNDKYERLKRMLDVEIPNQIQEIRKKIKSAKVIDSSIQDFDGNTVSIGTKVILDYDGEEEMFIIKATYENELENNIISCNTPIAQAIIGKKKGDMIIFKGCKVKIVSVEEA